MNLENEKCPFKVGDHVVYRPSLRGEALDVMASTSEKLTSGKEYTIVGIQKDAYVVVDEYHHPGWGNYWTEFEAIHHSNID